MRVWIKLPGKNDYFTLIHRDWHKIDCLKGTIMLETVEIKFLLKTPAILLKYSTIIKIVKPIYQSTTTFGGYCLPNIAVIDN